MRNPGKMGVADDKEVQCLDDNQENKMKKRKNDDSSLNGMQELGFSKPSKKMRKDNGLKNSQGEESQAENCIEFESNEGKDDCQYKKGEKKKKKKEKLSEENKSKEYNEFESNEVGEDDQGKKMKKKNKVCDESKSKENCEFNSKQTKKKEFGEENQHEYCNESRNKDKDGGQCKNEETKRKKKKKRSEESQTKEYNEYESSKGEDDGQGKKMKKKKLRDKRKNKENSESNNKEVDPSSVKLRDGNAQSIVTEVDDQSKKMKTKKKTEADIGESPNPAPSGSPKPKRVTFSDEVDICCDGLVHGKRFTPEEDEKIKKAVFDYIESHGLGDEGLDMVLHCISHRETRHCWKEIAAALPHRPKSSVYTRAHVLFERGENSKWTPEEREFLLKMKEQHGSDWKSIAEALGKHRFHVKDVWREIRFINRRRGRWNQEEYQKLFDLVNQDLCVRASQGYRQSKHGMLRDNIGWEAICDKLATRSNSSCCEKWYRQLTSPMVANGVWSDTDDYRLVNALFTLDVSCFEEVDWDNLLDHRPGDICRKRWNQMIRFIGEHGSKSFAEQVEVLAKRFCPNLLEAREAFDGKPVIC